MGRYYEDSIVECKLIKRKKLYGFDGGKDHKFILLKFQNTSAMNKAKNLWFEYYKNRKGESVRRLSHIGYKFNTTYTKLYEANIPPLLRYFHIKEISPTGWVAIPNKKAKRRDYKTTTCKYECSISYKHIIPLNKKETPVPYKICSFDIEASSSHGDFPVPVKSYKKLANNIMEIWDKRELHSGDDESLLYRIINTAFTYDNYEDVDQVFPKIIPSEKEVDNLFTRWTEMKLKELKDINIDEENNTIEKMFEYYEESDSTYGGKYGPKKYKKTTANVINLLNDNKFDRESKLNELNRTLNYIFPKLEGDKVTFIGSTFLKHGQEYPYLNHCIALNTCDDMSEVPNSEDRKL